VRRAGKGFTLMELMVALSIFAVITLTLYSAFAGGIGIWRRQEKGFKYGHNIRLVLTRMSKELRMTIIKYHEPSTDVVVPGFSVEDEETVSGLGFMGNASDISFVTLINGRIAQVSYSFESDMDEDGKLVRTETFQEDGFKARVEDQEDFESGEVLISGLGNCVFEYAYVGEDEDSPPVWQGSWGMEDELPKGVKIKLEFKEGDEVKEVFTKTVFIATGVLGKEMEEEL